MYEKRNLFERKRESKSKENSISFQCQKQFLLAQVMIDKWEEINSKQTESTKD